MRANSKHQCNFRQSANARVDGSFTNIASTCEILDGLICSCLGSGGRYEVFIRGSSPLRYTETMRSRATIAVVLTLLALSTPASAQWRRPHFGPGVQPLERVLPGIRQAHPGRFYDAEGPFPDGAGGMHYRIKWITPDGRVIWLDTDARSGRVIGPAGGPAGVPPGDGRFGPPVPAGPGMQRGYPPRAWGRPGFGGGWRHGGGWPH